MIHAPKLTKAKATHPHRYKGKVKTTGVTESQITMIENYNNWLMGNLLSTKNLNKCQ